MTDGPADSGGERRIIVLVGAVGAGKGTQAAILTNRLGLAHVASGDLFRRALRDGSELGEKARSYMERGELVPDAITTAMIMDRLARPDAAAGAILDGFPRTAAQARALDETLARRGEAAPRVVYIEVPTEDLLGRVTGRRVCPICNSLYHLVTDPPQTPGRCDRDGGELRQRDDDRPEVVRARLDKQVPPMLEVVEHYESAGAVQRVDGRQPIDAVTEQILAGLGSRGE